MLKKPGSKAVRPFKKLRRRHLRLFALILIVALASYFLLTLSNDIFTLYFSPPNQHQSFPIKNIDLASNADLAVLGKGVVNGSISFQTNAAGVSVGNPVEMTLSITLPFNISARTDFNGIWFSAGDAAREYPPSLKFSFPPWQYNRFNESMTCKNGISCTLTRMIVFTDAGNTSGAVFFQKSPKPPLVISPLRINLPPVVKVDTEAFTFSYASSGILLALDVLTIALIVLDVTRPQKHEEGRENDASDIEPPQGVYT